MDSALLSVQQYERRRRIGRWVVIASLFFVAGDFAYKTANHITYATREKCIIYRALPRPAFLVFEYFIELGAMVVVGVFFARLLAGWFHRYGGWYPRRPITAFLYGSLLPVCACTAIPLTRAMRGKLPLRTTIAFVLAAPLLSPYIIVLSFGLLGAKYGVLRIVTSCLLAVSAGYVVEWLGGRRAVEGDAPANPCGHACCPFAPRDACADTVGILWSILPWLLVAGAVGVGMELLTPVRWLEGLKTTPDLLRTMAAIAMGVPLYLCNGAEVLLLRPLMHQGGISYGTAIAFSLTSTSICTTSFVMLLKFVGTRATIVLVAHVVIGTLVMSYLIGFLS